MIWTLKPETHSSISSQRSQVSFVTTIASVALMFPWQEESRAAWSMVWTFQSSTFRPGRSSGCCDGPRSPEGRSCREYRLRSLT